MIYTNHVKCSYYSVYADVIRTCSKYHTNRNVDGKSVLIIGPNYTSNPVLASFHEFFDVFFKRIFRLRLKATRKSSIQSSQSQIELRQGRFEPRDMPSLGL